MQNESARSAATKNADTDVLRLIRDLILTRLCEFEEDLVIPDHSHELCL